MKRKVTVILIIIICFLLQSTLFQRISLGGIVPNLLIIITSAFGFMRGKKEGLFVGFFCGLLIDVFYGEMIGFYALLYMCIGYLNGLFHRIFYPEDVKFPIMLITLSDLIYCLCAYFFMFLLRARFHFPYYLVHIILPEVVYTVLITVGLYRVLLFINRKLEESEKRSGTKFV